MAIPKVAAIHDLSGFGRCSLTAAIPILSAMGVQACPLPTAVLSNQTGFPRYACVDLTEQLDLFADRWAQNGASFDGIFTGFLCGEKQAEQVGNFLRRFRRPETLVLVDPVLGDGGTLYPVFHSEMIDAVRTLVETANVITPNLTEACILTGADYPSVSHAQSLTPIRDLAKALSAMGPELAVITGVHQGGTLCNVGYDARGASFFCARNRSIGAGRSYSGTGDLLASVLCGGLLTGMSAPDALELAAQLLEASIAQSDAENTDPNEGVAFEAHLHLLL